MNLRLITRAAAATVHHKGYLFLPQPRSLRQRTFTRGFESKVQSLWNNELKGTDVELDLCDAREVFFRSDTQHLFNQSRGNRHLVHDVLFFQASK